MPRDYKKRSRQKKRRSRSTPAPALRSLLGGAALGAVVSGLAVYLLLSPRQAQIPVAPVTPKAVKAEPASARADEEPARNSAPAAEKERFGFYEMLPNFEVIIPEAEEGLPERKAPARVEKPGVYFLQAGSFRRYEDADRMKATLALQGIVAQVQEVRIGDDQLWHRVRVGPMSDLAKLHRLRTRLREADINAMLIRVAE